MKYIISRTSVWGDECPLEGCEKVILTRIDNTFHGNVTKEEYLKRYRMRGKNLLEWGIDEGCNYSIIEEQRTIWTLEIENLKEFIKKNGDIVLSEFDFGKYQQILDENMLSLEIYDDYRE